MRRRSPAVAPRGGSPLVVDGGRFRYPGAPLLLDDVHLDVPGGQLLAVLGPNGAGKTTLLRAAVGLLPWAAGRSLVAGTDIRELSPRELWRQIAYVPQARNAGALALRGLDMVVLGHAPHLGIVEQPGQREHDLALEVMEQVGVAHLRDVPCGHMSGGQLQMVLIARALVGKPRVLVLDEPETGLDFRNQLVVMDLIDRLVHKDGLAAVMNTHHPAHALRIADQALLLTRGEPALSGPIHEVITPEHLRRAFGVHVHIATGTVDGHRHHAVIPVALA